MCILYAGPFLATWIVVQIIAGIVSGVLLLQASHDDRSLHDCVGLGLSAIVFGATAFLLFCCACWESFAVFDELTSYGGKSRSKDELRPFLIAPYLFHGVSLLVCVSVLLAAESPNCAMAPRTVGPRLTLWIWSGLRLLDTLVIGAPRLSRLIHCPRPQQPASSSMAPLH